MFKTSHWIRQMMNPESFFMEGACCQQRSTLFQFTPPQTAF
jgi:hypothetical protein